MLVSIFRQKNGSRNPFVIFQKSFKASNFREYHRYCSWNWCFGFTLCFSDRRLGCWFAWCCYRWHFYLLLHASTCGSSLLFLSILLLKILIFMHNLFLLIKKMNIEFDSLRFESIGYSSDSFGIFVLSLTIKNFVPQKQI